MSRITERFWPKVDRRAPDECWPWTASVNTRGYGQFNVEGKPHRAHRVAFTLMRGRIPPGLEIDHLCRNPSCVNPAHLEPVVHAENVRRGHAGQNMAEKTHCPQGHPYDGSNTIRRYGRRYCAACKADGQRKRRHAESAYRS